MEGSARGLVGERVELVSDDEGPEARIPTALYRFAKQEIPGWKRITAYEFSGLLCFYQNPSSI